MFKSPLSKFSSEIATLEKIIINVLRENYTKGQTSGRANPERLTKNEINLFSQGWLILRSAFVDNPGGKDPNYLQDISARSSYILHYLMPNVQRWLHLFENCRLSFIKEEMQNPVVLDIGAGPATSALAYLVYFHKRIKGEVTFELTDYNLPILKDGKEILEKFAEALSIKVRVFITGGLNKELPPQVKDVDMVLMGNVWNESISSHEAARNRTLSLWSESIAKVSKPSTKFLMMEPASRRSSRLLMGMRDFFAEDETLHILAPCPQGLEKKPCALNRINGRPWCHFGFNSLMTQLMIDSNAYANISHDRLSYSYLILGYQKTQQTLTARVIGGIMQLEENMGCYLCHKSGRVVLESEDKRTLPFSGQALVKNLIIEKAGKEYRARVDDPADSANAKTNSKSNTKNEVGFNKPKPHTKEKSFEKPFVKDSKKHVDHSEGKKPFTPKPETAPKKFSPKRQSKFITNKKTDQNKD